MAFWNKPQNKDTQNNNETQQISADIEQEEVDASEMLSEQAPQNNDTQNKPPEEESSKLPEAQVPQKSKRELKREEKERIKAEKEAKKAKKKRITGFGVFVLVLFINAIWVAAAVFYFFPMYNDDIWLRESQIEEYENKIQTLQAVYDNMSKEYEQKIEELEQRLDEQEQKYADAKQLIEKYEQKQEKEQTDTDGASAAQDPSANNANKGEQL